ncbi:hypothetical protein [Algimonas arctica]|nr:hypothetical protein [Algimonas arctica]
MNDLVEQPALLVAVEPHLFMDWQTEDDIRLATLSHFGSPYCEGDTPLFI